VPFHTIEGILFCEDCGRKAEMRMMLQFSTPYCSYCEDAQTVEVNIEWEAGELITKPIDPFDGVD
jgi:hypothetical protein